MKTILWRVRRHKESKGNPPMPVWASAGLRPSNSGAKGAIKLALRKGVTKMGCGSCKPKPKKKAKKTKK